MPKLDQIYQMMDAHNTPYIRIFNLNHDKIFVIENEDVAITKQQMETLMPFISSYGKVIVEAADEKLKASNYRFAYKWNLEFDRPVAGVGVGTQISGPVNANPWMMPKEYVHQDVMVAKLSEIQAEMRHNREMDELKRKLEEKDKEDPMKHIEKLAPALLYLFGKPIEEVQKISGLYATAGKSAIAGPPDMHTLSFSDVEKLSEEEKSKKCQEALDELAKHISKQEMIILCTKLTEKIKVNPKFMETVFLYI